MNLILACDKNGVIGCDGKIPWFIKEDLFYFKKITTNNVVVMGRKTYESLPYISGRKLLPNRTNVVLSSKNDLEVDKDVKLLKSMDDVINLYGDDFFIIGGASLYNEYYNKCNKVYLTRIDSEFKGDTFFDITNFLKSKDFSLSSSDKNNNGKFDYYFEVYEKKFTNTLNIEYFKTDNGDFLIKKNEDSVVLINKFGIHSEIYDVLDFHEKNKK